jgi:SRSO17 transposase
MRLPIICLDPRLGQYLLRFRHCFSKPQYKYFVTILLGLMLCQGASTLTGVIGQVEGQVSLSGSSRFLSIAPWSAEEVSRTWFNHFASEMASLVEEEHTRRRAKRPKRRGRPKATVVTGYLIGDDSVMQKMRGKKMGGLGTHYSSTAEKTVTGHCLVQALYVLLGRRCPLAPQMYLNKAVCEQEGVAFQSKVDLMKAIISDFEPVVGTQTHVLLDSWYTAKKVWKAARDRDFLITSGLKCNRQLRIDDLDSPKGWSWLRLDAYAARLSDAAFTRVAWPSGSDKERGVYVHVVSTRVKKLYRCQVILMRESLNGKTRYWASSDLDADLEGLLEHIAARWDIEQLFADTKELLGLDQYQLMSAKAIRRFWTLAMLAYCFLDEERVRLQREQHRHTTIGDAWRHTRQTHWRHFIDWMHTLFVDYGVSTSKYSSSRFGVEDVIRP